MFRAFGNISGHNFYMDMQNGSKLSLMFLNFLFTPLNQRYDHQNVSHTFVQGSHTCIFAVIYTSIETSPNACIGKPRICGEPACIVGLQLAILHLCIQQWADFQTIFFLLCRLLEITHLVVTSQVEIKNKIKLSSRTCYGHNSKTSRQSIKKTKIYTNQNFQFHFYY